MINSASELLNDIVVDAGAQTGKPAPKASQSSGLSQKNKREFILHYDCLQATFLRCSWLEKMNLLTHMMQSLSKIDSLSLILSTLMVTATKSTVYAESQYITNFVYDKTLLDNNRSLHERTLKKTLKNSVDWFGGLEDSEQVLVLIGLIRLAGGSISHELYRRGCQLYNEKIEEHEHVNVMIVDSVMVQIKPETSRANESEFNFHADLLPAAKNVAGKMPKLEPRSLSIIPSNMRESEKCDPKDPHVVQVTKQRAIWDATITKYRIEVEGKPASKKKTSGKNKKGSKSSKSTKSSKKSKSSKSSKADKKGKKAKKGKDSIEALDWLQMLPIWIVKKIFSYLDKKTLSKAKQVNTYWTYAVADLQKDVKARKYLDKFIHKMEASITSSSVFLLPQLDEPALKEMYGLTSPKRRLRQLAERGATLEKLQGRFKKPLIEESLATNAVQQAPKKYILPFSNLESFARNVANSTALYKVPSCLVNELGFTKTWYPETPTDNASSVILGKATASAPDVKSNKNAYYEEKEIEL